MTNRGVLLLAHGTVNELSELPAFLTRIRRGRPPGDELIAEMTHRYQAIGGSPLLRFTNEQAAALQRATGLPCFVAMRLWQPGVEEVLPQVAEAQVQRLCLLPLAPFSVDVYCSAARAAQSKLPGPAAQIELVPAPAWGTHPDFIAASAELIQRHLPERPAELILTAHSLPMAIIRGGDSYGTQAAECAAAIGQALGRPVTLAFQSEGAGGGEWLGPGLEQTLRRCAERGVQHVVVAPFGFLADHVETLYDLDIEARQLAEQLGLGWTRVPALNLEPAFIRALAAIAHSTLAAV